MSHIINVTYSIALRSKEDKCSCTLLESNELSSFEKNLRGAGRRTLRGDRTAFWPLLHVGHSVYTADIYKQAASLRQLVRGVDSATYVAPLPFVVTFSFSLFLFYFLYCGFLTCTLTFPLRALPFARYIPILLINAVTGLLCTASPTYYLFQRQLYHPNLLDVPPNGNNMLILSVFNFLFRFSHFHSHYMAPPNCGSWVHRLLIAVANGWLP